MAEALRILVMLLLLVPLLLMTLLAGCGYSEPESARAERIAAKVNGDEIAVVHAVNAQSLEQVIDQALLAQQAREARLEREPGVAQALEDARRNVLAQAWLERLASGAPRVTADEVKTFYAANPALFSERRIYYYEELTAAVPARLHGALAAETAVAGGLDEIALWLGARGVRHAGVRGQIRPAEEVPFIQLRRLAGMREGELAVLAAPGGVAVVQLVQSRQAPVTETEAASPIEQFLANRRRAEMARSEVKRLRQGAQIEYLHQQPRNRQDPLRTPVKAQQVSTTITRRQP
jgi:EpsD family peptidyl-prolyl cis-trans isomerase